MLAPDSTGAPTESGAGHGASTVNLTLPGLNIQWPYSQLVLAGAKTEEVREYDLGHRNIQFANVETYLVETKGLTAHASRNAVIDGAPVGPRPESSQIVGTVIFSRSEAYTDRAAFRADVGNHRIREDGAKDWDGRGQRFKWRIAFVRRLARPIPCKTGQTGWNEPRSFEVTFAAEAGVAWPRGAEGRPGAVAVDAAMAEQPRKEPRVLRAQTSHPEAPPKKTGKASGAGDGEPKGAAAGP